MIDNDPAASILKIVNEKIKMNKSDEIRGEVTIKASSSLTSIHYLTTSIEY